MNLASLKLSMQRNQSNCLSCMGRVLMFCLFTGISLLWPLVVSGQKNKDNQNSDARGDAILRATGGEPVPGWDLPNINIFGGPKPGVRTPGTDAPFSANTNTSVDVWSGSESPGVRPAYAATNDIYQTPRIAPPQMSFERHFVGADSISVSSFGPNQFCVWDTKLYLYADQQSYIENAILLDGATSRQLLFVKGPDAMLAPSFNAETAVEEETREYSRLIPDSSQNAIGSQDPRALQGLDAAFFTNTGNPGRAILEKFDGTKMLFELVAVDGFIQGRLTHVNDRFGTSILISYQVPRNQLNSDNIDSMWKIHQVHDRFGPAYEFNYGALQHAGRWCVEELDVLNEHGGSVTYTYGNETDGDSRNDGRLIGVTYADGNTATYQYDVDNDNNPTVAWNDPASTGTFGRTATAHLSNSTQTQNGELANQPSGALVEVTVDASYRFAKARTGRLQLETRLKVTYLDTYPELLIETGGTIMKITAGGSKAFATQAEDPCNHLEPNFAQNTYGDQSELLQGTFSQTEDETGQTFHHQYGPDGFPIKKTYDLGESYETFEEWSYGNFYNVTRYRDREGRVTKYVYDDRGLLLERQVGILDNGAQDAPQPEYAVYRYAYYPAGHINAHMLKTEFTPRHNGESDMYRTDYVYDNYNRVIRVTGSAETSGGTRPVTRYFHDLIDNNSGLRMMRMQDPEGRNTRYRYDVANRVVKVVHHDGSSATTEYGVPGQGPVAAAQLPIKQIDRTGDETTYVYDAEGRLKTQIEGANAPTIEGRYQMTYFYYPNSALLRSAVRDNKATLLEYDYRARQVKTHVYPSVGNILTTECVYLENRKFYTQDPYGRRKYVAYNENGTRLRSRVLQYNRVYDQTNPRPTNRHQVLNEWNRLSNSNASYTITDYQQDHSGNLVRITDGRDTDTIFVYDSRNRRVRTRAASNIENFNFHSTVNYNADDTVESATSRRYHDPEDAHASQRARLSFNYNGRSLQSRKAIVQDPDNTSAVETFYHLDNRVRQRKDARGFNWYPNWHDHDGRFAGEKNPRSDGLLSNTDFEGRVTHTAHVANYDAHNANNPANGQTLQEVTIRHDRLGRITAKTSWLVARGVVDRQNPPIAGLDGISEDDGLTTQYLYDNRIGDNQGLDGTPGMVVQRLGGGTYNVDLDACLTKLAEPVADGGGGVSFTYGRTGCATAVINGEEEIYVEICDALDRRIMSAYIEGPHGENPNNLVSWSCNVYDTVSVVDGFGKTLEHKIVDAEGNVKSSFIDGGGRLLQVKDQRNEITTLQVDATDNVISVRDPNGVGYDAQYDELNRMTSRTDTYGDQTRRTYDRIGNVTSVTDSKNVVTRYEYNAADQLVKQTNRLQGVTTFAYDLAGNLVSLTDAESKTTLYEFNNVGLQKSIAYPDHTPGSNPNTGNYGKVLNSYDAALRPKQRTDQRGTVIEYVYDLAGRATQRNYYQLNTASADFSDIMKYDRASRLIEGTKDQFNNTIFRSYDVVGRMNGETLLANGQNYTTQAEYNSRGLLTKLVYPDGSEVDRAHTARGQLHQVSYEGLVYDTRTYDHGGRPETITYRNGVVTTDAFRNTGANKDDFLAGITTAHPPAATALRDKVGDYSYSYDANKNKKSESITGKSSPYGFNQGIFDPEDRLTQWKRTDGNQDQSWELSLEGDWDEFTEEGVDFTRSHNAAHETTLVDGQTVLHDLKGNLTRNTNGHTYNWNFDNHMTRASTTGGANDIFFRYDVDGRRIAKTTPSDQRIYVCFGSQVMMEYDRGSDPSTGHHKYLYGSYVDEPTVMFRRDGGNGDWIPEYYHRNSQFSIVALTSPEGKVTERYAYDAHGYPSVMAPSGNPRSEPATDNPYLFTGRRWDKETRLYYFRARCYDPLLGRFLSRDPSGYSDGTNLYKAYFVHNYQDPSGRQIPSDLPLIEGARKNPDRLPWSVVRKSIAQHEKAKTLVEKFRVHGKPKLGFAIPVTLPSGSERYLIIEFVPAGWLTEPYYRLVGVQPQTANPHTAINFHIMSPAKRKNIEDALWSLDQFTAFAPGLSDGRDIYEAITGTDFTSGRKLSPSEVDFAIKGAFIPIASRSGVKNIGEGIQDVGDGIKKALEGSKKKKKLHRGVPEKLPDGTVSPAHADALEGTAKPRGGINGHRDPQRHNDGDTATSGMTSWTESGNAARRHAGDGTVLTKEFDPDELIPSPNGWMDKDGIEHLFPGTVTGAEVKRVKKK